MDADARTEVRGLDEHRVAEARFRLGPDAVRLVSPLRAADHGVVHHREPFRPERALHHRLVHGRGGADDSRPDVGEPGQLEEPLHGAVLAEGAVQQREDHVEARGGKRGDVPAALRARVAVPHPGRGGRERLHRARASGEEAAPVGVSHQDR